MTDTPHSSAGSDAVREALQEMVSMMDRGDEHGAGSEWHRKAVAALAEPQPAPVEIEALQDRIDRLEDALRLIVAWSEAYPLKIFPKPDLLKARELLEAGGITLDSVSAHAMRHVVESVGKIARGGLDGPSSA
jgi:hypothetical protein